MVPRLNNNIGPDLTLIRCIETFAVYMSRVIRCIRDDVSDKVIEIEAEIEVNVEVDIED